MRISVLATFAVVLAASPGAGAGDLLRGGGAVVSPQGGAGAAAGAPAQGAGATHAADALARTTQALQSVQAMQAAARALAIGGSSNLGLDPNHSGQQLPNIPNGLAPGGLQVAVGVPADLSKPMAGEDPALWQGAALPTQSASGGQSAVTIAQTGQQAILNWKTFNIGKATTLTIDQSAGGANASEWIAFNKINDPLGVPSQILGSIQAQGQVYVINPNGIIFGGSSQVSVHALVASSLPINDNLVARGLLNNPDNQFLFSSLALSAGSNGTPAFNPAAPATPGGADGDVVVQPGATLTSPTNADHVGGRIALIGPNVTNGGTISTPDGQTILAAGQQVGFTAHASGDPSLRGLDAVVGKGGGTAANAGGGIIEAPRGDVSIAGKTVNQLGLVDSSTSVAFNGRIDLSANYNAISSGGLPGLAPFFSLNSGVVTLGQGSVTQILPELSSTDRVVGTQLALPSQINIQGSAIHLASGATILAPAANLLASAGNWNFTGTGATSQDQFVYTAGQIYLDSGSTIDVSGSANVAASISENVVAVQLLGTELANSPLQRNGPLRGQTIQVDIRQSGVYNGVSWVGTPLADASGYAALVQRTAGELTSNGGSVKFNAGGSVVIQSGASINVSGGSIAYQGGLVQTTQLLSGGHVVDVSQATPDRVYDGIYTGSTTTSDPKWGTTQTSANPALAANYEPGYVQGGNGGSIAITAPSLALDGTLLGTTSAGPWQRSAPPAPSSLSLVFQGQDPALPLNNFPRYSPAPPAIVFQAGATPKAADPFALDSAGNPLPLRPDRQASVVLSPDLVGAAGFGSLKIDNSDGAISVPAAVALVSQPGGSISLIGANIDIQGQVAAPAGSLSFTAYDISPFANRALTSGVLPVTPPPDPTRGMFTLGAAASLSTAGLTVDDRPGSSAAGSLQFLTRGGAITVKSFNANLAAGSTIDVSGGVAISAVGKLSYGSGGAIDIAAGQDPGITSVFGGHLGLGANLMGYAGNAGGSLSILAPLIQVGGFTNDGGTLLISPDFFSLGGFSSFTLKGLGAKTGSPDQFIPGIVIAPGTTVSPVVQNRVVTLNPMSGGGIASSQIALPQGVRAPVSLTFNAVGVRDPFNSAAPLVVRGDLLVSAGAVIQTDPKGSVTVAGDTATVLGSIFAPGGSISISGGKDSTLLFLNSSQALPTVDLGPQSVVSAAGTIVLTPDPRGYRTGSVLPGGSIGVSGNIIAEAGARLDVSGASGVLDIAPSALGGTLSDGSTTGSVAVPSRVDSNGGSINFAGAQELFSDATLMGGSGGPSALGGTLTVSSGRFYPPGTGGGAQTPLDVTLAVTQGGPLLPAGKAAVGTLVLDAKGAPAAALGHFAADRFNTSGFDALTLNGTVQFTGPVNLIANRSLTIGNGGVLYADSPVSLSAPYVALGTPFQPPQLPQAVQSAFLVQGQPFYFPPAFGSGSLAVAARLIDIGNLSLQAIGKASFIADNGDIRGDGTLDVAGDIYLRAGQIYPPTEVAFTIAAYNYNSGGATHPGSVTIAGSGSRPLPLSAGGQLNVFASAVTQGGVLRAPIGAISLGWNGAGLGPTDLITGKTAPPTQQLTFSSGSVTSVSAIDPATGQGAVIPYGINLNGTSWIDPAGTDITSSGAPVKSVSISAGTVTDQSGSSIDISGGGDLYAYRFVSGVGGTNDILASSSGFAVIPGYQADYAPYARYNSTANLGADSGYASSGLSVGDRVYLNASSGLSAGFYTLLPARYALLPGAFLVTPQAGVPPSGAASQPDGSSVVSGYRFNDLSTARVAAPLFTSFNIAAQSVIRARAQYDNSSGNGFLGQSALTSGSAAPRLPIDSGQLVLAATLGMAIQGSVSAQAPAGGLGGLVDISSPVDILIGTRATAAQAGVLTLDSSELSAFGAESLLIGGVRQTTSAGTAVAVKTPNLTVANAGEALTGPDIILAASKSLKLAAGADVEQSGALSAPADTLLFGDSTKPGSGDGALLRVSANATAPIVRSGVDSSAIPALAIGAGSRLVGSNLTLDSTRTMTLDSSAFLSGKTIVLDSGRINLLLANPGALQTSDGLVLSGLALQGLQTAQALSLLSYTTIDIYGTGQIGALDLSGQPVLGSLALHAAEIRGFAAAGGTVNFAAQKILLDNSPAGSASGPLGGMSGTLAFNAGTIQLGANQIAIDQYANLALNSSGGVLVQGSGGLAGQGGVAVTAPAIAGASGANQAISAGGALTISAVGTHAATVSSGLGASLTLAGASVTDNANILLPSGGLMLHATSGDVQIGTIAPTRLDVGGTAQTSYDIVTTTNGGQINLISDTGLVNVASGSTITVAAQSSAGNAGSLAVSAPNGVFTLAGSVLGQGGAGGKSGAFSLDVGSIPPSTWASLNNPLNSGGFTLSRSIRVRGGDVVLSGLATASSFNLSTDQGSITVGGTIDASGAQGGTIGLEAHGGVTLASGALLTVAGANFSDAGKGGAVTLEAGTETNGVSGPAAFVDIQSGSTIDLSVANAAGAGLGNFTGTLHLRAPQTAGNADLQIKPINGTIAGASSIVAEGYQVFNLTPIGGAITSAGTIQAAGGTIANSGVNVEGSVDANGTVFAGNAAAIAARLLPANGALASVLHVRPGAEVINTSGDLSLDSAWDLSSFRYGPNHDEPGVLTLRAAGSLDFNAAVNPITKVTTYGSLSDGFGGASANGLWDAPLLKAGSQSWSYRLIAGADFGAADFHRVRPLASLGLGAGSLLLGQNTLPLPIPANPASPSSSSNLRQSIIPNFYQVIRTGTGDIDIAAGRDVLLLNPLATIYTAGTQAPAIGNFDLPQLGAAIQNSKLGPVQNPIAPAQYSLGGGNVTIAAQNDLAHELVTGSPAQILPDSSKEMPANWLYRRGAVDPATGQFTATHSGGEVQSTSWWIDFSNFFEGIGALGGGNVTLTAGRNVSNIDAVIPTNARMPKGAPNAANLLELGGGDLAVRAGNDIDGGVYYVERGQGALAAGGSIHTNSTRAAITEADLIALQTQNLAPDPTTWLPTTLFLGKGSFDVTARGDLLLGPVANPFLLPQGVNNNAYDKSYFSTYAATDAVNASSLTGTMTLRDNADGGSGSLANWFQNVLLYDAAFHKSFSSYSEPWLRLLETDMTPFTTVAGLMPSTLRATAFSGSLNLVGSLILSPSAQGTIDLFAAGSISGMQVNGLDLSNNFPVWGSSLINLSDADPSRVPGIASPLSLSSAAQSAPTVTPVDLMNGVNSLFDESGSTQGARGVIQAKQALHASGPLHAADLSPVHLYASSGSISGITLFAGKSARVLAGTDITDISLYLQNNRPTDISVVAAARDLIAYDPNSALRVAAQAPGNEFVLSNSTVPGPASGNPTAGDIQIGGPGTLEVLAGRNFDLGVGPNAGDGTAVGVTSIGNSRNPNLPFGGADIVAGAGIGPSSGLDSGSLDTLAAFYLALRDAGRNHNKVGSPGFGNYNGGFQAIAALFPGTKWQGDISLTSREIKTSSGGNISLYAPGGQLTVGLALSGNPPVDQGILTEDGGNISIFTQGNVNVGTSRIFTLRGGNEIIWSSAGNIAAGASSKTVQSAPPTRVLIDPQSADVKTDLAGLATGGGIGVLETVAGVPPADVDLIAPAGTIDAGDAGIRVSGNLNVSAVHIVNASNIQVSGASVGTPSLAPPSLGGLVTAASTTAAGASSAADEMAKQNRGSAQPQELPSIITVDVIGYGGS